MHPSAYSSVKQSNCYRWWQNYAGLAVNNKHYSIHFLLQTHNPSKAQGLYSAAAKFCIFFTDSIYHVCVTHFFRMTAIISLNSINLFGLRNEDKVCFVSWKLNFPVSLIRILSFGRTNFSKLKSQIRSKHLQTLVATYCH